MSEVIYGLYPKTEEQKEYLCKLDEIYLELVRLEGEEAYIVDAKYDDLVDRLVKLAKEHPQWFMSYFDCSIKTVRYWSEYMSAAVTAMMVLVYSGYSKNASESILWGMLAGYIPYHLYTDFRGYTEFTAVDFAKFIDGDFGHVYTEDAPQKVQVLRRWAQALDCTLKGERILPYLISTDVDILKKFILERKSGLYLYVLYMQNKFSSYSSRQIVYDFVKKFSEVTKDNMYLPWVDRHIIGEYLDKKNGFLPSARRANKKTLKKRLCIYLPILILWILCTFFWCKPLSIIGALVIIFKGAIDIYKRWITPERRKFLGLSGKEPAVFNWSFTYIFRSARVFDYTLGIKFYERYIDHTN